MQAAGSSLDVNHHDTSPGTRLPCPSCRETFGRPEHLTRHLRKHTGEKPFVCSWCGKSFPRSDSMKRHETLHLRDKPASPSNGQIEDFNPDASHESSSIAGIRIPRNPLQPPGQDGQQEHVHHNEPFSWSPSNEIAGEYTQYHGLSNLDPPAMSDINWLPIIQQAPVDLNPFDTFWDSPPDWPSSSIQPLNTLNASLGPAPDASLTENHGSTNNLLSTASVPGFEASMEDSPCSHTSIAVTDTTSSPQGGLYVDGGVTRLAKGRKRTMSVANSNESSRGINRRLSLYGLNGDNNQVENKHTPCFYVSNETYNTMARVFRQTCTGKGSSFQAFDPPKFLSIANIDDLVAYAVDYFLPTFPFVHKPTLQTRKSLWSLYLALAAIGAHYEVQVIERRVQSLNEFLWRSLTLMDEEQSAVTPSLEYIQTKTLASIALLYSGIPNHKGKGKALFGDITGYCESFSHPASHSSQSVHYTWVQEESAVRTCYAIWLLDCMLSYDFSRRPLLHLEQIRAPLPCTDPIWQASSSQFTKHNLFLSKARNPSLQLATERLFMEKTVDSDIGEFGRILLAHAVYRQTCDILKQSQSEFASWRPYTSAEQESQSQYRSDSSDWAPAIPRFSKWRNAACDCLDVLHWHANAIIGASSGQEHPTVLFLHLIRVLMLSPVEQIRQIARGLSRVQETSKADIENATRYLVRWAHQDGYKARLAIIHAGVLMYHVRRHSLDSFYEPSAVFLSTLCLWAYGSAHLACIQDETQALHQIEDAGSNSLPQFIQLDRPCDDELVQLFVTNGNVIKPIITGVGDICSPEGPIKILKLGCGMLRYGRNWDLSETFSSILTRLQSRATGSVQ